MHKKYKLDHIAIFGNNLSTHKQPLICYTLNHNSGPLLCTRSRSTKITDQWRGDCSGDGCDHSRRFRRKWPLHASL